MITCWKCRQENADGMRFCTNCGAALGDAAMHNSGPPSSSQATLILNKTPQTVETNWPTVGGAVGGSYASPPPIPEKKSRTGLIVGSIIAILVLGIVVVGVGIAIYQYTKPATPPTDGKSDQGVRDSGSANQSTGDSTGTTSKDKEGTASSDTKDTTATFAPPTEATKDASFTIYANEGWKLSSIAVLPEEEYTTRVDGIIDISEVKAGVRSGGVNDAKFKSRRIFPEWPTGALLMRTRYADGRFSNTVALSAGGASGSWKNLPDERGMLEFRINDNAPENNGGQFTVRVKMTRVPKPKTPKS